MKKILKSRLFQFLVTAITFTTVGVIAEANLNANMISYTDSNNNQISVKNALDHLYNNLFNLEYYTIATGGKTNTASSVRESFTISANVEGGRYIVIVTSSFVNASSMALTNSNTLTHGTLSGCSSSEIVRGYRYGAYTDGSVYANHTSTIYKCSVDSNTTIKFTTSATNDDRNTAMTIFKY